MNDTTELIARNRAKQAELYGEPLGELLSRLMASLGLTQARVARVLGLSAPMLSQLASGQRIKIGNPVAVQRLQALGTLAADAESGAVRPAEVEAHLAEIGAQAAVLTHTATAARPAPAGAVRAVQGLLRATASEQELTSAAKLLSADYPQLAELLRVYGVGQTSEGIAHYEAHEHLM